MRIVDDDAIDIPLMKRILAWVERSPDPLSASTIAAAFDFNAYEREFFVDPILDYLVAKKLVTSVQDKKGTTRYVATTPNSPVMVVRITGKFPSGHLQAQPTSWDNDIRPVIKIKKKNHHGLGLDLGDHLLIAVHSSDVTILNAKILQRLSDFKEARLTGTLRNGHVHWRKGHLKTAFEVVSNEYGGLVKDGDVVEFSLYSDRDQRQPKAHVRRFIFEPNGNVERLGDIALIKRNIAAQYPRRIEDAVAMVAQKGVKKSDHHIHFSHPFVTIDPVHAKDHDDAVYARPAPDGGHDIWVAIADVAHYVRPQSDIDKRARLNGFSNYPLNRVIHMLPKAFAEDLLSLKKNQLRRAMVIHMRIDDKGKLTHFSPARGIIQVRENLSYSDAEVILRGDQISSSEIQNTVENLNNAYQALRKSLSDERDLEMISGKIIPVIDQITGQITGFEEKIPDQANDIVEKLMVLTNATIAQALEEKNIPFLRRAHIQPDHHARREAEDQLRQVGFNVPESGINHPSQLNDYLLKAGNDLSLSFRVRQIIGGLIPRAIYTTKPSEHWGLALPSYAHFTSPIRRYADILVHRALITAFPYLGEGGYSELDLQQLDNIGDQLNFTEENSRTLEKDMLELYASALMSKSHGQDIPAVLLSAQSHGVFLQPKALPYAIKMPRRDFMDVREGDMVYLRVTHANPLDGRLDFARATQPINKPKVARVNHSHPKHATHNRYISRHVAKIVHVELSGKGGIQGASVSFTYGNSNKIHTLPVTTLFSGSIGWKCDDSSHVRQLYSYGNRLFIRTDETFELTVTKSKKGNILKLEGRKLSPEQLTNASAAEKPRVLRNLQDLAIQFS